MISGTITDASGRTLTGQTAEAFWNSMRHAEPISIGFNCALGADAMRPHVKTVSDVADTFVSAHPNAGLPNASVVMMKRRKKLQPSLKNLRKWSDQYHRWLLWYDAGSYPRDCSSR